MANALNREIKDGEVVVVAAEHLKAKYADLEYRLFECTGSGFGMSAITHGNAVFGKFLAAGENCRIEGWMIDPKETEEYQKEHGKFLKGDEK